MTSLQAHLWQSFKSYTKNQTKIMIVPKSDSYLQNHGLQAHLQVMLWKVADQQVPHDFDGIARSVLLFQALQLMIQTNLNLSTWFNASVRQGIRNVRDKKWCMRLLKIVYFLHTILQLCLGRSMPQTVYKPLAWCDCRRLTNINDCDGDYYADLDIKIRYNLSF